MELYLAALLPKYHPGCDTHTPSFPSLSPFHRTGSLLTRAHCVQLLLHQLGLLLLGIDVHLVQDHWALGSFEGGLQVVDM